jgi:murein DD-endopeptidase MepM/ murein hydrolase activator NlpD
MDYDATHATERPASSRPANLWPWRLAPAALIALAIWLLSAFAALADPILIPPTPTTTPARPADVDDLANLALRRQTMAIPRLRTYVVQDGDTASGIAERYGLDVDTLRWSNPDLEENPDYLRLGMELLILPVRGVYHQVSAGDTIDALATRYGVAITDIVAYPLNALQGGDKLTAGRWLVVPFGSKETSRPHPDAAAGYDFAWPIVGYVTQLYSAGHPAVDIGAPYGSAVYAARAGVVVYATWAETGYGYMVLVDHGGGYATVYSHLKGAWVSAGQSVARGQLIGEVGSTGNSTGPHVHFEIRVGGVRSNPIGFLPAEP